ASPTRTKTQTAAATNSFKANLVCVSRRPHRQMFPQELPKPLWHADSERWIICMMDQSHAWDEWHDSISAIQFPKSSVVMAQLPSRRATNNNPRRHFARHLF